jgi:preprotein translocase subunit YajC
MQWLQWPNPSLYSAQVLFRGIGPFEERIMFMTEAYAQAATGAPGAGDFIGMVVPLVAIMGVFYFLMIRPQQRKAKEHQNLLSQISRGDTVVSNGGLIGKVVKVTDDTELLVEIGENIKVRMLRQGIADVRAKGEPAAAPKK